MALFVPGTTTKLEDHPSIIHPLLQPPAGRGAEGGGGAGFVSRQPGLSAWEARGAEGRNHPQLCSFCLEAWG